MEILLDKYKKYLSQKEKEEGQFKTDYYKKLIDNATVFLNSLTKKQINKLTNIDKTQISFDYDDKLNSNDINTNPKDIGQIIYMICTISEFLVENGQYKDFKESIKESIKRIEWKDIKINTNIFCKLSQSTGANKLVHNLAIKKNNMKLDLYGNGIMEQPDFTLFIKDYSKLLNGINTTAVQLLDAFVMIATETSQQNSLITIPLKTYMEIRNLKDEKTARAQIKSDIEALKKVEFKFREKKRGKYGDWVNVSLYGGMSGIKTGKIFFRFTPEFFNCLPSNQFMYFPKEAFTFNTRKNPHSYYFARKISLHKRLNLGKPNENIIGVQTIINSSPQFPKYEDLEHKRFSQFILEPFKRDLNAITSFSWEFKDMEDEPKTYQEFVNTNIKINWNEYPNVMTLEKSKIKIIEKINIKKK